MERPSALEEYVMFKGRHFDQSVILLCVRWYLAYKELWRKMGDDGLRRAAYRGG
ncbi:transposase-like protein [Mesorhizobium jarvisii]